jgi:ribosome biogenesis protein BRX1
MMPHTKTDSKMQKKESLFAVNEIAEMKNCEKCLLFEGRKKKDIYMWAANVARGPSVKFEVRRFRTLHCRWGNVGLTWERACCYGSSLCSNPDIF